MNFFEILTNVSRIAVVIQAWEIRINKMNFGKISRSERISRILRLLERIASDPDLDSIIEDKF